MNKNKKTTIIIGILILVAYSMLGSTFVESKLLGMFLEIISGASVIGIAVLLFPYFKKINTINSKFYLSLKIIEGTLMFAAGFFVLTSQNASYEFMYSIHFWAFVISAYIFYQLFQKSKLIPKYICVWGKFAVIILLITHILELLKFNPTKILYLPIILNEFYLAFYLIIKGFDK